LKVSPKKDTTERYYFLQHYKWPRHLISGKQFQKGQGNHAVNRTKATLISHILNKVSAQKTFRDLKIEKKDLSKSSRHFLSEKTFFAKLHVK
jgi:hypothetical protein